MNESYDLSDDETLFQMVQKCIKEILGKILAPNTIVSIVTQKDLVISPSYLGKLSFQIHKRTNRIMKNKLPYCNIRFIFRTKCKMIPFFTFKDRIPSILCSCIFNKNQCGGCNPTYYAKTKSHLKVKTCEH